jgi:hypothetical protein
MKNSKLVSACIGVVAGFLTPLILTGQVGTTGSQTTSPSPSPGGGITAGGPIETTLLAYRSIGSDAEAVSREVAAVALRNKSKIVIGTATDVAAFAQWRAIMGEAKILEQRAAQLDSDLRSLRYTPPLSLLPANLHVIMSHSGSFVQGRPGTFLITVSNDPLAGPTAGPVVVTESLPTGLALTSSMSGTGWACDPAPGVNCSRNDVLAPGASYDAIRVSVTVANNAPTGLTTNSAVVTGGGSLAASVSDAVMITLPVVGPLGRSAVTGGTTGTSAPSAAAPASPFSVATGAIPTFVQLAQFLATAFAVNQTLTAAQGPMTDTPLIGMVARHLREAHVEVFVPSIYTPNLLRQGDLSDTYLWTALTDLDRERSKLWIDLAAASRLLNQANFVTLNPAKYRPAEVREALLFAGEAQAYINSAQLVATTIDSFEASLFGGQAPASSSGAPGTASPSGSASPSGNPSPSGSAAPGAGTTPAGPTPASASAFTGTQATTQAVPNSAAPTLQGSNILPQILGSDLLAQRLWEGVPLTGANFPELTNGVNFLALHALQSGGSQVSKSNIFYGVHIFFSGGAVMTFSLYEARGDLVCSGFAYNYRGDVREKNYERALRSGPAHNAILNTDFSCPVGFNPPNEPSERMSEDQVINVLGPPDSKHFGIFKYFSRGLVIRFKDHRVFSIEHR